MISNRKTFIFHLRECIIFSTKAHVSTSTGGSQRTATFLENRCDLMMGIKKYALKIPKYVCKYVILLEKERKILWGKNALV